MLDCFKWLSHNPIVITKNMRINWFGNELSNTWLMQKKITKKTEYKGCMRREFSKVAMKFNVYETHYFKDTKDVRMLFRS